MGAMLSPPFCVAQCPNWPEERFHQSGAYLVNARFFFGQSFSVHSLSQGKGRFSKKDQPS
jgi:hypothetical protein